MSKLVAHNNTRTTLAGYESSASWFEEGIQVKDSKIPRCWVCKKRVQKFNAEISCYNQDVTFVAECHGQKQTCKYPLDAYQLYVKDPNIEALWAFKPKVIKEDQTPIEYTYKPATAKVELSCEYKAIVGEVLPPLKNNKDLKKDLGKYTTEFQRKLLDDELEEELERRLEKSYKKNMKDFYKK